MAEAVSVSASMFLRDLLARARHEGVRRSFLAKAELLFGAGRQQPTSANASGVELLQGGGRQLAHSVARCVAQISESDGKSNDFSRLPSDWD